MAVALNDRPNRLVRVGFTPSPVFRFIPNPDQIRGKTQCRHYRSLR